MSNGRKYRVVIIEPSPALSRGLRELVASDPRFTVVGEASEFNSAAERLPVLSPDIIVANPGAPGMPEVGHMKDAFPSLAETVVAALTYSCVREEVLRQYDETISIFDDAHTITRKLASAFEQFGENEHATAEKYELSSREKEILVSVARGLMNKEIADRHNISIHTVITHRKNITRKTGIKTVAGLTIYAILNGMIDMSDVE